MDIYAVVVRISANGVTLRWIDSLWIREESSLDRKRQLSVSMAAGFSSNYFDLSLCTFRLEDGCLAESQQQ